MPDPALRFPNRRAALAFGLLAALPALSACDDKPARAAAQAAAPRPVDVTVVTLRHQPTAVTSLLPGRTTPFRVAEVRPQVGGVLREKLFTEGEQVAAGQPLFRIDPAPFQAALDTAEAALARAKATADQAETTVTR